MAQTGHVATSSPLGGPRDRGPQRAVVGRRTRSPCAPSEWSARIRGVATNAVDVYWIPVGAGSGGAVVRWSGRLYEAAVATTARRQRYDLYHSALEVTVDGVATAVEMAPVWTKRGDRDVVSEGPVGARLLGRSRLFRYEVRCCRGGSIPDLAAAVGGPRPVSEQPAEAEAILALTSDLPTLIWSRDELHTGEMWNSNSLVSWLLARAGLMRDDIAPPAGGWAPGWDAGLIAAARSARAEPRVVRSRRADCGQIATWTPTSTTRS